MYCITISEVGLNFSKSNQLRFTVSNQVTKERAPNFWNKTLSKDFRFKHDPPNNHTCSFYYRLLASKTTTHSSAYYLLPLNTAAPLYRFEKNANVS